MWRSIGAGAVRATVAFLSIAARHRPAIECNSGLPRALSLRSSLSRRLPFRHCQENDPGALASWRFIFSVCRPRHELMDDLLRRDPDVTILTRLVALCTHHRPQSRHISGKYRSVPILALSRPNGIARVLMLPTESKCVQRAVFQAMSGWGASSSFFAGKPLSAAAVPVPRPSAGRRRGPCGPWLAVPERAAPLLHPCLSGLGCAGGRCREGAGWSMW